jgi:hypothetical protein
MTLTLHDCHVIDDHRDEYSWAHFFRALDTDGLHLTSFHVTYSALHPFHYDFWFNDIETEDPEKFAEVQKVRESDEVLAFSYGHFNDKYGYFFDDHDKSYDEYRAGNDVAAYHSLLARINRVAEGARND